MSMKIKFGCSHFFFVFIFVSMKFETAITISMIKSYCNPRLLSLSLKSSPYIYSSSLTIGCCQTSKNCFPSFQELFGCSRKKKFHSLQAFTPQGVHDVQKTRKPFFIHSAFTATGSTTAIAIASSTKSIATETSNHEIDEMTKIFRGKRKWLGGAISDDKSTIYGIPAHAHSIIRIRIHDTANNNDDNNEDNNDNDDSKFVGSIDTIPLPTRFQKRRFKWLRGILVGDYLFGIPSWSSAGVLRVNIDPDYPIDLDIMISSKSNNEKDNEEISNEDFGELNRVEILPLPNESSSSTINRWLWHGAAFVTNSSQNQNYDNNDEGICIYCIPANANHVLKITSSLTAENRHYTTSYIGPDLSNQCNKWYGGILGWDRAIYGIPYSAGSILRIDTTTTNNDNHHDNKNNNTNNSQNSGQEAVELLGDFGTGKYNWHGGVLSPLNGAIYAFPSHADTVLKIDTNQKDKIKDKCKWTKLVINVSQKEQINSGDTNGDLLKMKYKWLGGALGVDGAIYGMPSDCSSILRIEPETDRCYTFGSKILSQLSGQAQKNKWQGGVLAPRDGCIYAIPSDAECVLKIDTNPLQNDTNDDDRITLMNIESDFLHDKKITDKWQGGFLAADGNIYAIPENAERVLRVVVGTNESHLELL